VQVRLEGDDARRLVQVDVAVRPRNRVGRDVQRRRRLRELLRPADLLRHVSLRVEHHPELDLHVGVFAVGVRVIADARLLPGFQQHARPIGIDLGVLARGVLHQKLTADGGHVALNGVRRHGVGERMVDDLV
jgi:hypothetical protein